MENKILKQHLEGQKHPGKTDWRKVASSAIEPIIDNENPELVGKKKFVKATKKS